jgi:hypothetical protein
MLFAAVPTMVTIGCEWTGLWSPSNLARAVAGVPLGVVAGAVVASALATVHYGECVPPRPTVPRPPHHRI